MSAEIINLRRARKEKARAEGEAEAAANRRKFGRTKSEKAEQAAEEDRVRRTLDGHRREGRDD